MWIEDGEKYALLGLDVGFDGQPPLGKITPNLWVLTDTTFDLPPHWQDWMGSIRARQIKKCDLFIFSRIPSASPGVLDDENKTLIQRVSRFYDCLLLSSVFSPSRSPVILTGSRRNGEVDVRQLRNLETPVRFLSRLDTAIRPDDLFLAAQLSMKIEDFSVADIKGGFWRLNRMLDIYRRARTMLDILERIHQFCRCVESLILPNPGKTKAQFRSRTALFIGPHLSSRHGGTL